MSRLVEFGELSRNARTGAAITIRVGRMIGDEIKCRESLVKCSWFGDGASDHRRCALASTLAPTDVDHPRSQRRSFDDARA